MGLKLRAALLSCLAATAAYTGVKAYRSIVPAAEAVPEARGKPVLFQPTRLTYRKDDIAKATKLRWNLSSLRFFWLNNVKTPGEYAHNSKNLCKFAIY